MEERLKVFALDPREREKRCGHVMVAWSARVPCTGTLRCLMCGAPVDEGGEA